MKIGDSGVRTVTSEVQKKFRRKSLFKHRCEANGSHERPKKRARDDNDMFGLDKLIGIMSPKSDHIHNEEIDMHGGFLTPDLNKKTDVGGY